MHPTPGISRWSKRRLASERNRQVKGGPLIRHAPQRWKKPRPLIGTDGLLVMMLQRPSVTSHQIKHPPKNCKRPPQVRCEACSKAFDKRAGRRKRFCTDACRMAAQRAKTESSVAFGNALKTPYGSIGCEAISPDPYPSRFSVPLDLLGARPSLAGDAEARPRNVGANPAA